MKRVVAAVACISMLAAASTAQAARFASPTGSGTACSEAAPCLLQEAIAKAKANDEVIVRPGTYPLTEPVGPEPGASNVYIHGDFNGPMPQIVATGTLLTILPGGSGTRFAYLDISNKTPNGFGAFCNMGGSIERVRATTAADGSKAVFQVGDCLIRDSIARAAGTNAIAVFAPGSPMGSVTPRIRNVTAIASGSSSKGVVAACSLCIGTVTVDAKNLIADGALADLEANIPATGKILVSNSNFDNAKVDNIGIVDLGGNQTAPPRFVDGANGDYRQAAGSPTIDAGVAHLLGAFDFDGNPRLSGPAPDIGAFEFVPPAPAAEIQSLTVAPKAFRALRAGGAIISAKKRRVPLGSAAYYTLSAAATVQFGVERKTIGRRSGKKCVKRTKANKDRKRCTIFKPVKGGFTHSGAAGANRFRFSGRLSKPLAPGLYRLTGRTGASSRSASFKIVK